jgi:hypothetical protein
VLLSCNSDGDHAKGYVASMINVPVGMAQFCDVPPAGIEPATAVDFE